MNRSYLPSSPRGLGLPLLSASLLGFALLVLLPNRSGAETTLYYLNGGVVQCPPMSPPQVDAINFINDGYFQIDFTNLFNSASLRPYGTANTLNYTNFGRITGNVGFNFENFRPSDPVNTHYSANNFYNSGTLVSGGSIDANGSYAGSRLFIWATNIENSGEIYMGPESYFGVKGNDINLSRGILNSDGFESDLFASTGLFDLYWGVGNNNVQAQGQFQTSSPSSPAHVVTEWNSGIWFPRVNVLSITNAMSYVFTTQLQDGTGTNWLRRVVFIGNTNSAVSNRVFMNFFPGTNSGLVVEWNAVTTNLLSGNAVTNYLYLEDTLEPSGVGEGYPGPPALITNFYTGILPYPSRPTGIPNTYLFVRGGPYYYGPETLGEPLPAGTFYGAGGGAHYASYSTLVSPSSQLVTNLPGQSLTNMPGRIELNAGNSLDLTLARMGALNYFSINSTNHFVGSAGAKLLTPWCDLNLGSTNGTLVISNLLLPVIPRLSGNINLYSTRFTNNTPGFSVRYHVLLADSHLSASERPYVNDVFLRATNVIIGDIINSTRKMVVDAENLLLTTNAPDAVNTRGELNFQNLSILWAPAFPRLQTLTNYGAINTLNSAFFGGQRTSPFYSSNFTEPYLSFYNAGEVACAGVFIYASNLFNSGLITAGSAGNATLVCDYGTFVNGRVLATNGDLSLSANRLVISNHTLIASRLLTLSPTNLLTDGNVWTNGQSWSASTGFRLLVKPTAGDLLATTVTATAVPYLSFDCKWAATNKGCVAEGFKDNAALGRYVLSGGANSQFYFKGVAPTGNAIYVDTLEFANWTTNTDAKGNYIGIKIETNFTVYYAEALKGGQSIAEKLNGKGGVNGTNGGRFCWVSSFAGPNSSTNLVYLYSDGRVVTNTLNRALVQSCTIDSNGNGTPNCAESQPIFTSADQVFTAAYTATPVPSIRLHWLAFPTSTSRLYCTDTLSPLNWQLVWTTNLPPSNSGVVPMMKDLPLGTNRQRFYNVRVDAPQP